MYIRHEMKDFSLEISSVLGVRNKRVRREVRRVRAMGPLLRANQIP